MHTFALRGASRSRNGAFIPMLPILSLLAVLATAISCEDVAEKIQRTRNHKQLSEEAKAELIEIYKIHLVDAVGLECNWDANV